MYKFSVYDFSEKEILQIVDLVKRWAKGDRYRPVDTRRITNQVKDFAKNWNLLEKRGNRFFITCCSNYKNISHLVFHVRSLPVEVLWRLVLPMLREDDTMGYSIVNNKLWMDNLGIAPQNHKHATDQELTEKEDILLLLSSHRYIGFQMAGTVWSIYQEKTADGNKRIA